MSKYTICVVPITIMLASSASAQSLLFVLDGSWKSIGASVARIGDLDSDGFADIAVTSPLFTAVSSQLAGAVIACSSQTGAVLRVYSNGIANEGLGFPSLADGDVDGDGVSDLIAAAGGGDLPQTLFSAGKFSVFSGLSGNLLFGAIGPHAKATLGSSVACLGDLDLDGFPDVAVGAQGETTFGPGYSGHGAGAIHVYSGNTGVQIKHFAGTDLLRVTGRIVRGVGDVDQDGRADVLYSTEAGSVSYEFEIVSGAVLSLLGSIPGSSVTSHHPDVDGDGIGDPVISEVTAPYRVVAFSGATLSPLLYSQFPAILGDGLNDVNFDGHDDFVALGSVGGTTKIAIVSGADGGLLRSESYSQSAISDIVSFGDVNGDGRFDFGYATSSVGTGLVYSSVCGKTTSYGSACPPTIGATPAIAITNSCPTPGGAWNMTLSGPPGSALLMVGAQPAAAYIGGGCQLLVGPPATLFPIPFAFGFSILNTKLPLTSPVGNLYLQLFCSDPTKPWGYAASKGLEVTID